METRSLWQSFKDTLLSNATVKTVYGDPVTFADRTIVPVARVAYGFGGGFGSRLKAVGGPAANEGNFRGPGEEGGGGGGGVAALPVGVVEVTATRTRFIRFGEEKRLAAAIGAGLLLGWWIGTKWRK